MFAPALLGLTLRGAIVIGAEPLPEILVTEDDTQIRESCRVVIGEGLVIADDEGNGVIHIVKDGVTVEFAEGSVLRGAPVEAPGDGLRGLGVLVEGVENVTLRGLRVHGFRVGVSARRADGLVVEDSDLSANYRQRLGSNAEREDAGDWLYPHRNENNEWVTQHGAALAIEESDEVTVRRVRVRDGQNGVVLDEVNDSRIYDNDCSFLSGWGLAMWRSSRNTVSRNAFDFCIRGHEEGVYNRGQDSAGILMFEQCNENLVVENSCTHGGDGIFGFGGLEAIGEVPPRDGGAIDYADAGCNDNVFIRNDLSYASAHGFEMTFSERNVVAQNRMVENGICGVWGGYSSDCEYVGNEFRGNGAFGYGAERGGINIEHGSGNRILENSFENNRVGVRFWWDDDQRLLMLPGVKAAYRGVTLNRITDNTFVMNSGHDFGADAGAEMVGIQIQDFGSGGLIHSNITSPNSFEIEDGHGVELAAEPGTLSGSDVVRAPSRWTPTAEAIGDTRPVGARPELRGRDSIVMGEWGPWDHEGVFVRRVESGGETDAYEIRHAVGVVIERAELKAPDGLRVQRGMTGGGILRMGVSAEGPGVHEYTLELEHEGGMKHISGRLVYASWHARFWNWEHDPLVNLAAWREEGQAGRAVSVSSLDLPFAGGGPGNVIPELAGDGLGRDRFALIATTTLPLKAGTWRVRTVSDDGIRVIVDGKTLIERWDIHAPNEDSAAFTLSEDREVSCVVEYFENDGYATLGVWFEPVE